MKPLQERFAERESLIPVVYRDNMGQLLWDLVCDDGEAPILALNGEEGLGLREAFDQGDNLTKFSISAGAFRLALDHWWDNKDSNDEWIDRYIQFFKKLDIDMPDTDDDPAARQVFFKDAISKLSDQERFASKVIEQNSELGA